LIWVHTSPSKSVLLVGVVDTKTNTTTKYIYQLSSRTTETVTDLLDPGPFGEKSGYMCLVPRVADKMTKEKQD